MSRSVTENGEHGARAIRVIANGSGSWWRSISLAESLRIASSVWTTESGGSPPCERPRDMLPRVGWKRIPSSLRGLYLDVDEFLVDAAREDVHLVARHRAAGE